MYVQDIWNAGSYISAPVKRESQCLSHPHEKEIDIWRKTPKPHTLTLTLIEKVPKWINNIFTCERLLFLLVFTSIMFCMHIDISLKANINSTIQKCITNIVISHWTQVVYLSWTLNLLLQTKYLKRKLHINNKYSLFKKWLDTISRKIPCILFHFDERRNFLQFKVQKCESSQFVIICFLLWPLQQMAIFSLSFFPWTLHHFLHPWIQSLFNPSLTDQNI